MEEYHKIQTVFKRDPETKYKTMLLGEYSIPEFEYLNENEWEFTEKVDGTNIRIIYDGILLGIKGKTDKSELPSFLQQALVNSFMTIRKRLLMKEMFPDGVCLYGEGYGEKIQSGGKYRADHGFVLFDVRIGDLWLQRKDIEDVAENLGISVVPVVGKGTLHAMVAIAKEGFKSTWGDFLAEGIVARPAVELKTRTGARIITKIKHRDFR